MLNAACKENRTKNDWKRLRERHSLIAFSDLNSDNITDEDKMKIFETPDPQASELQNFAVMQRISNAH